MFDLYNWLCLCDMPPIILFLKTIQIDNAAAYAHVFSPSTRYTPELCCGQTLFRLNKPLTLSGHTLWSPRHFKWQLKTAQHLMRCSALHCIVNREYALYEWESTIWFLFYRVKSYWFNINWSKRWVYNFKWLPSKPVRFSNFCNSSIC